MTAMFAQFNAGDILAQNENWLQYRLQLAEGAGTAEVYAVLPGVEVILLDFLAPYFCPAPHRRQDSDILEINHCLTGRAECRMGDGCLQYLGENDLFLSTLHNRSDRINLPLGFYHGLTVMIDLEQAYALEQCLPSISFRVEDVLARFFAQDNCFLITSKEEIRGIFAAMYTIPQEARGIYYRLKILELLLYLHYFDQQAEPQKPAYAQQQVDRIKQIQKQITAEPSHRFTIEELAKQHCISATALKAGYKAVYGTSIAAYMKDYRMQLAADLLRNTTKSIEEIAVNVGYESQSKFGAAFKAKMQLTPSDYRKKYQRID